MISARQPATNGGSLLRYRRVQLLAAGEHGDDQVLAGEQPVGEHGRDVHAREHHDEVAEKFVDLTQAFVTVTCDQWKQDAAG